MEETLFQILNHPVIMQMTDSITTLNGEVGQIQIDIAILQTQMASIIYWGRFGGGVLVALLLTQIFQIFQIRKNGKK